MSTELELFQNTEVLRRDQAGAVKAKEARTDRRQLVQKILSNPLLPTPPALAWQIVDKASDPDCEVREICALLACDPVLCGKMLKIVNSALYCPSRPVTAIDRAVAILGFNRLRSLVLGMSIPAMQFRGASDRGLTIFWRRSVSGAIIASELSRWLSHCNPEEDLVATLLRNLGMILLQQSFPEQYHQIWEGKVQLPSMERCQWEEEHLGVDHAEVGAALLRTWRLPDAIVEPIRLHHRLADARAMLPHLAQRTRLVAFADCLAELADGRCSAEDTQQVLATAREQFALEPDTLEKILCAATPKIEKFAALVQLDIGNSPQFAAVLNAGCEELVRLSMQVTEPQANFDVPAAPLPEAGQGESQKSTFNGPSLRKQKQDGPQPESAPDERGDAWMDDHSNRLEPGTRLLNYQIVRVIGRGAMGVVYEALDVDLGRRVAIKTLAPQRSRNPEARQRFIREARTAAAVQHENVVSIFCVSERAGVPFIVMEYVAGRSLQEWLNAGRQFTVKEIVRIGRQTARGLAAAHALRIIHRDIKPANVLIEDTTERVRITDFGTARFVHSTNITRDGNIVGTPQYMSPEQVDGQPLEPTSDLFSLGSLLYTLCTGHAPFSSESLYTVLHMVATMQPKPIRELNPNIPEWLVDFVARLHAKEPAGRIQSAAFAAELLESFAPGSKPK